MKALSSKNYFGTADLWRVEKVADFLEKRMGLKMGLQHSPCTFSLFLGSNKDKFKFRGEIGVITQNLERSLREILEEDIFEQNEFIYQGIGATSLVHDGNVGMCFFDYPLPKNYKELLKKLEDLRYNKIGDSGREGLRFSYRSNGEGELEKVNNSEVDFIRAIRSVVLDFNMGITDDLGELSIEVSKPAKYGCNNPDAINFLLRRFYRVAYKLGL